MYHFYTQYILAGAATPRCERSRINSFATLSQLFRSSLATLSQPAPGFQQRQNPSAHYGI